MKKKWLDGPLKKKEMKRIEGSGIINKKPQHPKTIPKSKKRGSEMLPIVISGIVESTLVELTLIINVGCRTKIFWLPRSFWCNQICVSL